MKCFSQYKIRSVFLQINFKSNKCLRALLAGSYLTLFKLVIIMIPSKSATKSNWRTFLALCFIMDFFVFRSPWQINYSYLYVYSLSAIIHTALERLQTYPRQPTESTNRLNYLSIHIWDATTFFYIFNSASTFLEHPLFPNTTRISQGTIIIYNIQHYIIHYTCLIMRIQKFRV